MAHEDWKCGDCGNLNKIRVDKCICGNPRPMTVDTPDAGGRPHGACASPNCPMTGTFTESVRGAQSWYCWWHWDYRGDYAHSARITQELLANRPPVFGAKANGEVINTFKKLELPKEECI